LIAAMAPAVAEDEIWEKVSVRKATGYVLLLRHAIAPGGGDPENFQLGDCTTQRNLSDEGRQQASEIGSWLKSKNLRITRVESSRWCRALETARLMDIGRVRENPNLDSLFLDDDPGADPRTTAIKKRIAKHRNTRGLLVLVFHQVNITALTGIAPASGVGVLVRAKKNGELKVMGLSPSL
jgi:phosphohistidine phosphatase SixA